MAKHFTLMCTWIFKFNDMWNAILLYFHIVNEIFDVRLPFIFREFPKLKYLLLVKTIGNIKPDPSKHLQTWNHDNPSVEINIHIFRCWVQVT